MKGHKQRKNEACGSTWGRIFTKTYHSKLPDNQTKQFMNKCEHKLNINTTVSGGPNVATILGCRVKGVGNWRTDLNTIVYFAYQLVALTLQAFSLQCEWGLLACLIQITESHIY